MLCIVLSLSLVSAIAASAGSPFTPAAHILADRLTECSYAPNLGFFLGEQLWQSGATMETISNTLLSSPPPRLQAALQAVLAGSFSKTPVIVDNCFDDHQWWGLNWVRAYDATGTLAYLQRAAAVFDFTAQHGWNTSTCGGGVTWCPPPTGPYKNAITAELFLSLAMALHPHAAAAGKPATYYSAWANTTFQWLAASGMINSQHLVNDGLNAATCTNNNQTTWTYNQGVLLSGLARLTAATGDPSPLGTALATATAAMRLLTVDGILTEPCPGGACAGQDGEIFKGMFAKHLGYLLAMQPPSALPPAFVASATAFLATNAASLLREAACRDGGFDFSWEGGDECSVESTATGSAALDLLLAAAGAGAGAPTPPPTWQLLGLGNCADAAGRSMDNCFKDGLQAQECRDAAFVTAGAVGFDFHLPCLGAGVGFCRVRTLAGAAACSGGLSFEGGSGAQEVAGGDGSALAACYVRS